MSGIYQIRNIKNNKIYIGSSQNINKRWKIHKYFLRKNKHHSTILQRAWNKYKENLFVFEILEQVENINDLITKEQLWFDKLGPQYNSCPIAGSSLGWKHTEETKLKLKMLNLGDKNPMKIKFNSNPIKNNNKNKPLFYSKYKTRKKPIIRISEIGEIKEYNSISEAAKDLNLKHPTSIQRALSGISKSSRGFTWKYKQL